MVKFKASQLWNELPNELKQIQSERSFKVQLKTYLLKKVVIGSCEFIVYMLVLMSKLLWVFFLFSFFCVGCQYDGLHAFLAACLLLNKSLSHFSLLKYETPTFISSGL